MKKVVVWSKRRKRERGDEERARGVKFMGCMCCAFLVGEVKLWGPKWILL